MANTKTKREQYQDLTTQTAELRAEMQVDEVAAMKKLGELLTGAPMKKLITEMTALQEQCVPGSTAEAQLGACINVPVNVLSWIGNQFPPAAEAEVQPTPTPAPDAAAAEPAA